MADAILALKVASGVYTAGGNVTVSADVNEDGKIGLEEAIYVLQAVAESDRFAARPEVRKAVARNPNTPSSTALRLLQDLRTPDLEEILSSPRVPQLIQIAAGRLLDTRRRPEGVTTGHPDPSHRPDVS